MLKRVSLWCLICKQQQYRPNKAYTLDSPFIVDSAHVWWGPHHLGESSNAVGLMPGRMVRRGDLAAGEVKGVVEVEGAVRKSAVLILAVLELKPLLSAMLLLTGKP
ncbi:putative protein transport protein Sec13 [Sesbania bispinosa]|nr:putative protein transport protein Sec13 [Sesbania bispinosa]